MKTVLSLGMALGTCLTLAACSTGDARYPTAAPTTTSPLPLAYDAVGDGWSLAIRSTGMTFQTSQGLATTDSSVQFLPHPQGDTYRGSRITAVVNRKGCSIEGYDTTVYPHTVTVTVNGQSLTGCGGPPNGNDRTPY